MFTINAVAQATGISIETLRAWERRYRIVAPARDPIGRRVYRPDDVIRLRKLREATERGHTISKLAALDVSDLDHLLATDARPVAEADAAAVLVRQILAAAEQYRIDDCAQTISLTLALLPAYRAITEVLAPALVQVGERWHAGRFTIAQEHLVSSSVKSLLSGVLHTYDRVSVGRPLVFATLAGERHEFGILMAALIAATHGIRCQYLGADVPAADIAVFAERVGATAVVLGAAVMDPSPPLTQQLAVLARDLAAPIELWAGGRGFAALRPTVLPQRVRLLGDYDSFRRQLGVARTPR